MIKLPEMHIKTVSLVHQTTTSSSRRPK